MSAELRNERQQRSPPDKDKARSPHCIAYTARGYPRGNVSGVPSIGLPKYDWGTNALHGVQSTCGMVEAISLATC